MFYTLKDHLALRGWEKLPYALVERPENRVWFLDAKTFDLLSLCDGRVDGGLPILPLEIREAFEVLKDQGVVTESEKPGQLLEDQKYVQYANRFIRTVHWSITGKCNYRCKHCYMSAPEAKLGELDHDTVMDIVDQIAGAGVPEVSLTGGEPLVRKDFLEIVDALLERKVNITHIYSNGKMVTRELLEALEKRGIHPNFNMSYDGDEGWHDWLRGIPNAGEIVLNAFDLCHGMGFPTGSEMCLHQGNKHLLRQSINTLAAHHCGSVKTNPVGMSDLWKAYDGDYSLSTRELFEIYLDYIPHYFEDGMPLSLMLGGFFSCQRGSGEWHIPSYHERSPEQCQRETVCGHARNVLYLSPEGRMLPCFSLAGCDVQDEFPLITRTGLEKGLIDSSYMRLIDTRISEFMRLNPGCDACEFRNACAGGCRASAFANPATGDLMGPDPAACLMFKGGYIPRIKEAAEQAVKARMAAPRP